MTLNKYIDNRRDNNFNLIRFIAALSVIFAHSFPLLFGNGVKGPLANLIGMHSGEIAVDIFFIISGFLVGSSFFNRKSIFSFILSRFLRVYPGLILAVFLTILLGSYFTTTSLPEYFMNEQTIKYFFKNITLFFGVEYKLPHVFENLPYPNVINGSLWTLPWEVKMYLYLLILGLLLQYINIKTKTYNYIFIMIGLSSILLYIYNHFYHMLPDNFIRLFSSFFIGVAFYIMRNNIFLSYRYLLPFLILLVLSSFNNDMFFVVYVLTLPYIVFSLAYLPNGKIRSFNSIGDYSYGIYIYAFPIQQSIVFLLPTISIEYMILLSLFTTLFFSIISWHFIESKALKLKSTIKFNVS